MPWGDIPYFLAVARSGSTAAAARELGVDATTVGRRIAALERRLGQQLFERRPEGYRLIDESQALLAQAERVEAEVETFEDLVLGRRRKIEGRVRVTGTEVMVTHILAPTIARLRAEHPGLRPEVIVADRHLDLARGAADVALRVGSTPKEPSLVGRRMPDSCWTVYCSRAYAAAHGRPETVAALEGRQVIGGEGALAKTAPMAWLRGAAPKAEVVCRCHSVGNLIAMVSAGIGVSVLPCVVGESSEELVRCFAPPEGLRGELWLLYHESQRRSAHIQAFVDVLAQEVRRRRHLLDPLA